MKAITLLLCLLPVFACAVIRTVSLDGTQQYTSIQAAVNAAVAGDVILVYPGRYIENIHLSNKYGIILASLEYTTGDTTHISSTIIDGSSQANSTILIYENTVNSVIRGFSITGGSGYDYFSGASPQQVFGGGIFFNANNVVILQNLNIYGNIASRGGGITIFHDNTVTLSNVRIHNNIARQYGGGLNMGSSPQGIHPNVLFSQSHRSSIYNNFAQWGMDIHWHYTHGGTMQVYLKKFTVPFYDRYFAGYYDQTHPPSPYTVFDIQESYLLPVDADLYVSPGGNDGNSGLSPAAALKTPSLAFQRIASNPDNPRTVHLLAGEHHNIMRGEYLPIVVKDHCILKGISPSQTRIFASDMFRGIGAVSMGIQSQSPTLRDLSITTQNAPAVFTWAIHDAKIENIIIENSTVDSHLFVLGGYMTSVWLKDVTMRNNVATYNHFGFKIQGHHIFMDNIVMTNNRTLSYPANFFNRQGGAIDIYFTGSVTLRNSRFINNTHYSELGWANFRFWRIQNAQSDPNAFVLLDNCLFASNASLGGAYDIDFVNQFLTKIVNCTFANNISDYSNHLLISSDETHIINCLFSGNNHAREMRTGSNTHIDHCLFQRSDFIWITHHGDPLQWGDNNLTGTNPLFVGGDPHDPNYYYLFADDENGYSPAIDSGTTDPAILPAGYVVPAYDLFGNVRLFGSVIDIGCYESPGYTGVDESVLPVPGRATLTVYPNPFSVFTNLKVNLAASGSGGQVPVTDAAIHIYNIRGQRVSEIALDPAKSGEQYSYWDGRDARGNRCSNGIYFINLMINGRRQVTRKVTLIR